MAYDSPGQFITLKAPSTAFSLSQYRFVTASSSQGYFAAGSSVPTTYSVGILQDAPTAAEESVSIQVSGLSKFKTDATLAAGAYLVSGANGIAVSTAALASEQLLYGPVLVATGGSSNIGTVLLDRFQYSS